MSNPSKLVVLALSLALFAMIVAIEGQFHVHRRPGLHVHTPAVSIGYGSAYPYDYGYGYGYGSPYLSASYGGGYLPYRAYGGAHIHHRGGGHHHHHHHRG